MAKKGTIHKKKKENYLTIGIILLITTGILQILSHFVRVTSPISSQIILIINSITILLFLIILYLYIEGSANKDDFSFIFGIIILFIIGMLFVTSHYIQKMYYSENVEILTVAGFPFTAHLIVDLVIFSIIGLFILLLIFFTKSRSD